MFYKTQLRHSAVVLRACLSTIAAYAQLETLDKIKRTGVFTAGVRADFPPIGSVDDKGEPIGFGPGLSRSSQINLA